MRKLHDYEPAPVKRRMLIKAARKLLGACADCGMTRPLDPDTHRCWPCDHLVSEAWPDAATDRQRLKHGAMCNDCAFRAESPEAQRGSVDPMAVAHIAMPGNSERSPESVRDLVVLQAKDGSGIFWCHKPFLEAEQEWGYDAKKRELMPLEGPHWRPCGGWCRVFDKAHCVRPSPIPLESKE